MNRGLLRFQILENWNPLTSSTFLEEARAALLATIKASPLARIKAIPQNCHKNHFSVLCLFLVRRNLVIIEKSDEAF